MNISPGLIFDRGTFFWLIFEGACIRGGQYSRGFFLSEIYFLSEQKIANAINLSIIISNISPWEPMGLYSSGLIFECFFCRHFIGLIFEGAYNRGGLYSRFYGISMSTSFLKKSNVGSTMIFWHSKIDIVVNIVVDIAN